MSKDALDSLIENLFELNPIVHKKLLRFDICASNKMLPINQMIVLGVLYEEGSLSSSEIGKKVCISKPQVTGIIDKLIKKELVERIQDKNDRRVINIKITEKGRYYGDNLIIALKENIREKLCMLSEEKLKSLANSLENITRILRTIN